MLNHLAKITLIEIVKLKETKDKIIFSKKTIIFLGGRSMNNMSVYQEQGLDSH